MTNAFDFLDNVITFTLKQTAKIATRIILILVTLLIAMRECAQECVGQNTSDLFLTQRNRSILAASQQRNRCRNNVWQLQSQTSNKRQCACKENTFFVLIELLRMEIRMILLVFLCISIRLIQYVFKQCVQCAEFPCFSVFKIIG